MAPYNLAINRSAREDLRGLYRDGVMNWGEAQADHYYDRLLEHFDQLCENPYLFPAVDHIRTGYRRSVCGAHRVYYRLRGDRVEVMAILGRQDETQRL